eukprot:c24548_g1_i1 orf=574-6834(-)
MSHHQSRADRSDSQQRRNARPGGGAAHQRASAKGSGAGGQGPSASAAPLLSPAVQSAPVPSSKRSGGVNGQPRGHVPASFETSESQRAQQNMSAQHQASNVQSGIRPSVLPSNGNVSRPSKAGTPSISSSVGSSEVAPIIPKPESSWNPGHPQLSFQFGSIGAAYVQIPARTSSAPPNLDEQKQDLLRFEAASAQAAKVPIPSGGQHQGPRSQVQQSGGQQQAYRPQPQQSGAALSAGVPQPPYHQGQQHPMPVQVTQPNTHLQAPSVVTTQAHLQMQAHLVPPQPQQQGLVQLPYSQHTLQPQMQHNGGQVLKYPQAMAGSPLMGPPLAPLPGPMPAPQITQMSHQLPGGLASTLSPGMPGAPYGVVPVSNPFIPPRTSSAVKIVHPETHEELKFDYKSSKSDSFSESGVAVTAAISQGRMVGNGPSHTRPSLGYGSAAHHSVNQNVYSTQQNGPYPPAMQHYYQPPPPTSSIPTGVTPTSGIATAVTGANASRQIVTPEGSLPSRNPPVSSSSMVSSREETVGISTAVVSSISGQSNSVPQLAAGEKNATSEKMESTPNIANLGGADQAKELKAHGEDKIVKVPTAEVSATPVKDIAEPVKQVQSESSGLASSKDSHRTESLVLAAPDASKNSKKKKKKDGPSRSNSGDALKVSKPLENKKQVEGKITDAPKVKTGTPKSVEQAELIVVSTAVTGGMVSEVADVKTIEPQAHSCNGERVLDNHKILLDEQVVSRTHASDNDNINVCGTTEEALPSDTACSGDEPSVNSVHKALVTEPGLSSDEIVENQGGNFTVQVDCKHSLDSSEVCASDVSPESANLTCTVEDAIFVELEASTVEATAEINQGTCKVIEAEGCVEATAEIHQGTCKVLEAEGCHETATTPDANDGEAESLFSNDACKEEERPQPQNDSVELQTNVQDELSVASSTKEEFLEETSVSAAPDVRHGSKKKKMKDILAKADAAGTTADLYNAYKAPEEKKLDEVVSSKVGSTKLPTIEPVKELVTQDETAVPRELDDWEDAVELPSPNVGTEGGDIGRTGEKHVSEEKGGETYTRDFLLTFKEQNMELPLDFEVRPDIAELLLNPQAAFARLADRDMHLGSGRALDRQLSGGPRRSISANTFDDDRWARQPPGLHSPLWPENYVDMGPAAGFRPGNAQGLIPRMPSNIRPGITVAPLVPGLIPGKPLTPAANPGLFRTNTVDSDRWQRMPTGQKGLIPSPHTPLPPVHKAEKRYEVGKTSDEEEQKQRQIKGILNKLTPQNFQKLFEQVKDVNIQSALTLTGVISQIFDKALTEPTFCEMYATFCKQLAADMPEFVEDGDKVTFKRVLLNKCQEEFHRGEREQAEASAVEEDGQEKMSPEEREERRVKAKRRMLGNIRFIGELYKKHMLTERIMHECIRKLLGEYENPEEEEVEALCKLMSTIGHMIDQPKTREHIDAYLERITRLSNHPKLSARIKFMLKDLIDLRRNGWQERRKVEGPKKIEEVHRDAVQERQATVAQAGRGARGPLGSTSGRRLVPPPELSMRGPQSPMFSPNTPMGSGPGIRGQPQVAMRNSFVQDVRMEDRLLLDSRPMPMPLSQRSVDEGPLTLGPQGGLGRGMSMRNQPSVSGRIDVAPGMASSESRRFGPVSMAAYSSGGPLGGERPLTPPERPLLDRPALAVDRYGSGSSNRGLRHLERTLSDRAVSTPTVSISHLQPQGISSRPSTAPAFVPLSEEQLKKKSEAALMEYFSARDLKEATQCVEDLRAPKFYPSMVYTWIVLSFEKKNFERELLAKLLISLQKSDPFILKQEQISQGFQMVMESLEDLALDTPKAPEYLAEMLVMLTSAGTLALDQVGGLLKKNDILQSGFGLDMIGKVLAGLRQDRGERSLVEMFRSSGIRLEDFIISGNPGSKSLPEFLQKYNLQCFGLEPDNGTSTNIQQVGVQLSEHLSKNEPISETLRWLERNITPPMQSDSTFLQMLMTQVLKHSIPAGSYEKDQRSEVLKDRISQYRTLLRKFATDKEKQRQYIVAMQLYVHDVGHPQGLMTTLFNTFYEDEVISESAYYKWEDDVNDPTIGRDKALRDVYRWLQWLRTAPEQSQDDEF